MSVIIQSIKLNPHSDVHLDILRADLNDPFISGNKLWKLKYNIEEASSLNKKVLISFGGAYSNHIYALAQAANRHQLKSVGIIRGDELAMKPLNKTLKEAMRLGMNLHFVPRADYQLKEKSNLIKEYLQQYSDYYLIPEGGTNELAVKAVEDSVRHWIQDYHIITAPVGTGGTLAGIINASNENQTIIGFPALKNATFLENDIRKYTKKHNFQLDLQYHFNGYGKINQELEQFLMYFFKTYKIPLDFVYTGKMMYGLMKNIKNHKYPSGSRILAIHTGGIQGNPNTFKFLEK